MFLGSLYGDGGWPGGPSLFPCPLSSVTGPLLWRQGVAWGSPSVPGPLYGDTKCGLGIPKVSLGVTQCAHVSPPPGHPVSPSVLGPLYGDRGWRGPSVSLGITQCPPVFPASVPQCPGTFLWGHRGWPGGPPLSLWPLPVSRDPCMVT